MKQFTRINHLVNDTFLPIRPGTILQRRSQWDETYDVEGTIFNIGLANIAEQPNLITIGAPHQRQFYTENNVSFNFGGGVGHGILPNSASIYFENKKNAFITYVNGFTKILNTGMIAPQLARLWHVNNYMRNYKNFFLVTSILETDNAAVIYSTENRTSVRVQSLLPVPIANINGLVNLNCELLLGRRSIGVISTNNSQPLLVNVARWHPGNQNFTPFI